MKIHLDLIGDNFDVQEVTFCGLESYLVTPHPETIWDIYSLIYRSLIFDKNTKEVLSSGWMKFFNYGESPSIYYNLLDFKDWIIHTKIDGSLLIVDYVNNQFSMRTRGTSSYEIQNNKEDFELLLKQYPKVLDVIKQNSNLSLLFEIETPNNVIVVVPDRVKFTFLGAINKKLLTILDNKSYVELAHNMDVPMPETHSNFKSFDDLLDTIKCWDSLEGVVISYNNNQNRVKIKSDWYCKMHRIKTGIRHINNVLDLWKDSGYLDRTQFEEWITTLYDYELLCSIQKYVDELYLRWNKIKSKINEIETYINDPDFISLTRKEKAERLISRFKEFAFIGFNFLGGKKSIDNIKLFKSDLEFIE